MTARAILENWLYWLLVDALSFYMYSAQGLMFVAMLYCIYFVIAIFGLRSWWQQRT
jgi:nicotinamide mononucleotide transporter